jgi:hypothetical protein
LVWNWREKGGVKPPHSKALQGLGIIPWSISAIGGL